jgi:adenine-specific DNA-methyltransferase
MRERRVDFTHPYLTRQIIAYIGNKRRLLPLVFKAIGSCVERARGAGTPFDGLSFLDLFAGSGAVSRFARYLGFRVLANDWEPYACRLNKAFLEIGASDLARMYEGHGGIAGMLAFLNSLPDPGPERQYIARHYCPSDESVEGHDFRKERLFYTRRNGLAVDKIRSSIEELYPEARVRENEWSAKEKDLLVALLLYEAATHTNTSGVFKAYHKGFGGHGKDALTRILAPIELRAPVLIDSPHPARVFMQDAAALLRSGILCTPQLGPDPPDAARAGPCGRDRSRSIRGRSGSHLFDFAYLDPPYNQHQYGSNYHMLNTIALWDKPPVSSVLNRRGVLEDKAAIRKDWVSTKSAFCYKETAAGALGELLSLLDSRFILLSYSTEGIIPFADLVSLCSRKGRLGIVTDEYVKYRGGKQSIDRLNRNIEFVLVIDTAGKNSRRILSALDDLLMKKRLALLFGKRYSLARLTANFRVDAEKGTIELEGVPLPIRTRDFFELVPPQGVEALGRQSAKTLIGKLEASVCVNREEELAELLRKVGVGEGDTARLVRLIPGTLKKLAHKKYRDKFRIWLGRVRESQEADQEVFAAVASKIDELERIAHKRFTL